MQGLALTARSRSWYLQRLGPADQRGVIRDRQSEPEQMDDGTDQPLGLPQRQTEHGPERQRRQDLQGTIPPLSAAAPAWLGLPGGARLVCKPDSQTAALTQSGIIRGRVRHLVLLLRNVVTAVLVQLERQDGYPGSGRGSLLR